MMRDHFRRWGYLQADIDPLGRIERYPHRDIDNCTGPEAEQWRKIYCGKIGAEFMHMPLPDRCDWIAERMEGELPNLDPQYMLRRILSSEVFERFLHTRYVGNKRFSLEGLNGLIVLLDSILEKAAELNYEIVVIGMAHRGRLNTMHHIAGIPAADLFAGFEDVDPKSVLGSGDVKYHKGATGNYQTASGRSIRIHLASNPSHLEAINPVLMGRVRARQKRIGDRDRRKVLAVVIHGDAAFAGQGIAAETLNFADLNGYRIGGTINIVANNVIGFTALPHALHSGFYATDVAKRLPVPIFHVNGESPNHVSQVGLLSMEYRNTFKSDVVIDLIGYRRYGHSEVDDPTITLPKLYRKIDDTPLLHQSYGKSLGISEEQLDSMQKELMEELSTAQESGQSMTKQPLMAKLPDYWAPYTGGYYNPSLKVETAVPMERLQEITEKITTFPDDFAIHPKLKRGFDQRRDMGFGKRNVDWGMAEALAIGSLLWEGTVVRVTGQDSRRGTFNHRQAVLYDANTREQYIPLNNLYPEQSARLGIYNSMLSEAAAVGYEYGFSRDFPESLVLWEAQFGDFANGAQIIIDQFISAAEDKWGLLSGLVLLLPHGFEGQGPEHSSARVERFLQLAAEDNIQVCMPSSAVEYFHLMRRQVLQRWRKPLIVFTPKSLLRAPAACSPIEEFANGKFDPVADDEPGYENAERILICAGKILHELRAERKKRQASDVAILSVPQLYPFPRRELQELLRKYSNAKVITWVQEEPSNMGARFFVRPQLKELAGNRKVKTVRRSESASPATGSAKAHAVEQEAIIELAFASYQ